LPGQSLLSDLCRKRSEPISDDGSSVVPYSRGVYDTGTYSESNLATKQSGRETLDVTTGRNENGRWIGGPFASHSVKTKRTPTSWYESVHLLRPKFLRPPTEQWIEHRYMPPFLSAPPTNAFRFFNPNVLDASPARIDLAITQAFGKLQAARNSARPDSTYADFAQSIAELRELSQLVNLRSKRLINVVGSAVLSVEFGWKPIISDVKKLMDMSNALKKRISFLKRNAGKPVRRKRTLYNFTEHHGQLDTWTFGSPYINKGVGVEEGTYYSTGNSVIKAEYHSVLSYDFHDDPESTGWNDSAARHLMGLSVDATMVWELAPFSWLVDWFTNIGDFVEDRWKAQLVDNVIHEEWITITCTFTSNLSLPTLAGEKLADAVPYGRCHSERIDTFKYRCIPPTVAPFEIVNLVGFSSRQQAIIASLFAAKSRYGV